MTAPADTPEESLLGAPSDSAATLAAEVDSPPAWMYAWQLQDGRVTPVLGGELPDIHRTRAALMETAVRASLAAAGSEATVIDLACNEGWFSHRVLEWGASRVLGIDIRSNVIRRAELLREHFGLDPERLRFRRCDVFELDPDALGGFDVVLCLGLIYHLENPVGALRIARALTRDLCVIETQLTKQDAPLTLGNGRSDQYEQTAASFAALVEHDQDANMLASAGGVVSLVPNRAALIQAARAAGFARVEVTRASAEHNRQYQLGDRAVMLAWAGDGPTA